MFHCCYFVTLIGVDFEMGDIFQVVVFSTFVGKKTKCGGSNYRIKTVTIFSLLMF